MQGVKEVLQEVCRGQRLQLWLTARSGAQSQSCDGGQMCRFNAKRVHGRWVPVIYWKNRVNLRRFSVSQLEQVLYQDAPLPG